MSHPTARAIGQEIEDRMEANGMDREKAIRATLQHYDHPDRARNLLKGAGWVLLSYCLRAWRGTQSNGKQEQPEQLRQDSTQLTDALDRSFPTGYSGVWKRAGNCTREDIENQIATWKNIVWGLEPRIDAGEYLVEQMDDADTLADMVRRGGEREKKAAATFLDVEYRKLTA